MQRTYLKESYISDTSFVESVHAHQCNLQAAQVCLCWLEKYSIFKLFQMNIFQRTRKYECNYGEDFTSAVVQPK